MPNRVMPNTGRMREVCDYIRSHRDEPLKLADLAASAGLSPFHFQRTFKAVIGLTPRQYVEVCRLEELKGQLRSTGLRARAKVTDAIYEAGFGSGSRVYERVNTRLGMTPVQYRSGGQDVAISYVVVDSTLGRSVLGRMMIGATDRGLCFVQFADRDEDLLRMLRAEYPAAVLEPMREPVGAPMREQFEGWMAALELHLQGREPRTELPLDLRATAFQMKVWRYLETIPRGNVQSYSEVAAGIGQPAAARAVARACAANRVAVVIPCHRVIRSSGELGGYRWGIERKRALLKQEGLDRERAAAGLNSHG